MFYLYFSICIVCFLFFSLDYKRAFILFFFVILLIQPIFQKLLDPSIYGSTLRVMSFDRIQTNLVFSLFFVFVIPLLKIPKTKIVKENSIYFLLFFLFNLNSLFFSEDIFQSLPLFCVAVVQPILFYYVLISINVAYYKDVFCINKIITFIFIFSFFLGLSFLFFKGFTLSTIDMVRQDGVLNLWISNYSAYLYVLITPFVLTRDYNDNKLLKYIGLLALFLFQFMAMSRIAMAVLGLQVLLLVYYKNLKFQFLLYLTLLLSVFLFFFISYTGLDVLSIMIDRFIGASDSVTETALEDARFPIYLEAINVISNNFFTGIGMGNFYKYTPRAFSDAHNFILSIWSTRGIFTLLMVVFGYIYFVKQNARFGNLNVNDKEKRLQINIKVGLICYMIQSFAGSELVLTASYVNAWPMYFLIFIYVIQMKLYSSYCMT